MDIPFFYHEPSFDLPEERDVILRETYSYVWCNDPNWKPPTIQEERNIFRQYNCIKYLDYMDGGHGGYKMMLRDIIFNNNIRSLRLVLSEWNNKPLIDQDEINSDAHMWLWDAIESYNYLMNHSRFTNYLHVALHRNLTKYYQRKMKKLEMFSNVSEAIWSEVEDHHRFIDCKAVEAGLQKLKTMIDTVDDESARHIMLLRLGLHDGKVWDLEDIAEQHGTTHQNIAKRFNFWMIKLFGKSVPTKLLNELKNKG